MKNILFATVRQGNCGDEFILFGAQNIISSLQPEYNAIIVNKNEEVCRRLQFRGKNVDIEFADSDKKISFNLGDLCFKNLGLGDNSFAEYHSLDCIDAVVFAGTPEWAAYKILPLYKKLEDFEGPILFLGPGYHEGFARIGPYSSWSEEYKKIHKKANAFIVRDSILLEYLKPDIEATLLPCPALLCSKTHRKRKALNRIGFTLQAKAGEVWFDSVPEDIYQFSVDLLERFSKVYEVEVVCHWIEDLIYLNRELKDRYILRYCYDAKDYLEFYDSYDLVISTRVHGSGMAASLGVPTFTISHSARTDTVNGFLSRIINKDDNIEDLVEVAGSLDIGKESLKIMAHKQATLEAYKNALNEYLPL